MELIDTHAHLDEDAFAPDLDEVLLHAEQAGLTSIITIGTTAASSARSIELAASTPFVWASVGIHPNYASEAHHGDWEIIETLVRETKVVALGETGLDKYWDFAPLDVQRQYFSRHLALSRETGLPFIVHCRDAEDEVLEILEAAAKVGPLNGVMHSFCGSEETGRRCLDWGMYLSFSGMITYKKNKELLEMAARCPDDRILVETDAPYLAPTPHRGKRNESAFVKQTAQHLADAKGMPLDELSYLTTENARRLFQLTVVD
ncbi:MAG: TatD family hydrolase [Planctomycetota bacterium]|nr:TatD family hydrolase [Planctomycetota bacterium]MDA1213386.1 TatD family hydrolase [Planctomycetota bacterium]